MLKKVISVDVAQEIDRIGEVAQEKNKIVEAAHGNDHMNEVAQESYQIINAILEFEHINEVAQESDRIGNTNRHDNKLIRDTVLLWTVVNGSVFEVIIS